MSAADALDTIWQSYIDTIDCLKVASRCISTGRIEHLDKTGFIQTSKPEAEKKISASRKNADEFLILSLWAVFERSLFFHLQKESDRILQSAQTKLTLGIHEKIKDEIEYWRVDDVLDLFKTHIDPNLIGNAKQVKKYRDWVAHRNPNKLPTTNVPPHMAYKVLSEIASQLSEGESGSNAE